jgi:outer membrane protein TolC
MSKLLKITAPLLLACTASAVSAEMPGPESAPVSLDSCRSMALHNNKELMIARQNIRKAGYQHKEAFSAYLPAFDFAGGYMYNQRNISIFDSDQLLPTKSFDPSKGTYEFNLVKNPETGMPVMSPDGHPIPSTVALIPKDAMTFDIHNVFFGAVTLTQPVFMGGKIVAMNKLTKAAERLAQSMHTAGAENVIYAVDAAYWQVVSLKAKHELATSYVNLLDSLSRNVHLMLDEGIATRADALNVDVKLNSAQVDLVKVENGLTLSRMLLAQTCGLPVNAVFPLADEDTDLCEKAGEESITATTYNMADVYSRRPDLRALDEAVEIARQQKNVARASMMPNLALVGAYSFSNPNMFDGFKKRFSGAFSVGAMLTIPIWHWGGNYNKYKAAESDEISRRLQLDNARELVDLQVNQASFKTKEAAKTYDMTTANLRKADENLRTARLAFREGMATADNVMEAQTAWLKAHSEQIDAAIDVRLCRTYLSKALGTLY